MKVSAGYVIIENHGDKADKLLSVSADWARKVELHNVRTNQDGVMEMLPVKNMILPAHGKLYLRPGGQHIMLYQLTQPLVVGQKRVLEFNFAAAGKIKVVFTVRPITYKGKEEKAGF